MLGQAAMAALGVGVLLPFSRKHESEADYIGILLAADAGYDPREAVPCGNGWGRCPVAVRRRSSCPLKKWMPEAMDLYQAKQPVPVALLPGVQ
jgi:hypothetical protein